MRSQTVLILRCLCWIVLLGLIIGGVGQWSNGALGQQQDNAGQADAEKNEAEGQPDASQDESETEPDSSLGMLVVESGWFSWIFYVLLGVFSIVALMVAMERLLNLRREKIIPDSFVNALRELVARNDANAENFRSLSDSSPSPVARILKAGVLRAGRPLPEVEKSMEDAAAREMADLRSRNRPLNVVGNIAPLIGLLGTVVGMIFAFSVASHVGLGKAEELAKGIYLALLTTAGGLTIAIPAMLASAWFSSRVERFMREIDESLLETMPSFARMENHVTLQRAAVSSDNDRGREALATHSGESR